jgi:PIN domain nuclease of toxin-antitoxin system
MTVLLDTCVFLWMADDSRRLSPVAREILEDSTNVLRLLQVTPWEIQIKHSLGKLPLPRPPRLSVPEAIRRLQLDYRTLDDATIYTLEKVPHYHRDPFDRLLVAHAIQEGRSRGVPEGRRAMRQGRIGEATGSDRRLNRVGSGVLGAETGAFGSVRAAAAGQNRGWMAFSVPVSAIQTVWMALFRRRKTLLST